MTAQPPDPVAVPDPVKPGHTGFRWQLILAGFGLGIALSFGVRYLAWGVFVLVGARDDVKSDPFFAAMYVLPAAVMLATFVWLMVRRWRAAALGLAIWTFLAGPLVAIGGAFTLMCRNAGGH